MAFAMYSISQQKPYFVEGEREHVNKTLRASVSCSGKIRELSR